MFNLVFFTPIWDQKGGGGHILHTSKISSSVSLKNKLHVNPVETFHEIDEKTTFDLILLLTDK